MTYRANPRRNWPFGWTEFKELFKLVLRKVNASVIADFRKTERRRDFLGASENRQTHSLLTGKEEEELRVFFGKNGFYRYVTGMRNTFPFSDRLDKTNVYMRAIHDERLGIYSEMFVSFVLLGLEFP